MMATTPRNIYEQQAQNKRLTLLVLTGFVLFVGFLGLGLDMYVFGYSPGADDGLGLFPFPVATIGALALGGIGAARSAASGDTAVLSSATATPVDENDPKYRQLVNIVEEMAIAAGVPKPKIAIVPDPDPNAFATGLTPERATIAVTEGLVARLNREELQAVVAHEMGHIRNMDIRLMTIVAALIGTVLLISEFGTRMMRFGGVRGGSRKSGKDSGGGGMAIVMVLWVVAIVLAPIISQLLAMAVSRQREFLADASAAELTRNPLALASALTKIDDAVEPTKAIKKGTAHLCIADPLGRPANEREGTLADLFATHPPIAKRVTLLKAMAYQKQ
jgi:heat shock protein HtpX